MRVNELLGFSSRRLMALGALSRLLFMPSAAEIEILAPHAVDVEVVTRCEVARCAAGNIRDPEVGLAVRPLRVARERAHERNPRAVGRKGVGADAAVDARHALRLAIDAMEEVGTLKRGSRHVRADGMWQIGYMFQLGLIIGGGTAQIQKNIISEIGLGMPREPRAAKR